MAPPPAEMIQPPVPPPLQPPQPPPPAVLTVPADMIQTLLPLSGHAEGLAGGIGNVPGMLGALTAIPGVGHVPPPPAAPPKADDKTPAPDVAGTRKRAAPEGKEEGDKDTKKKARSDAEGGSAQAQKLCPHGKAKATCMECMGCPHGKRRQNCKDCNAGSRQWCAHGKRRHDCQECSGCPHGRIKRSCKDCAGSGICMHGKLKRSCRECSTDMCEHKRRRYYCRDCKGAGSCEHNNRRWRCRECNGRYTCEHGFIKTNCLQCEMVKAGGATGSKAVNKDQGKEPGVAVGGGEEKKSEAEATMAGAPPPPPGLPEGEMAAGTVPLENGGEGAGPSGSMHASQEAIVASMTTGDPMLDVCALAHQLAHTLCSSHARPASSHVRANVRANAKQCKRWNLLCLHACLGVPFSLCPPDCAALSGKRIIADVCFGP